MTLAQMWANLVEGWPAILIFIGILALAGLMPKRTRS